jgi:galactonate dehydratase
VLAAGVAVAQPDLSYAGGISEVRRIASLAETFDAALAPHCPLGPIAFAASLQIAFASPNFLVQEQYLGIDSSGTWPFLDLLSDRTPFRYVDGYIHRPCGPGLGLDVDEGAVRDAAKWAASRPLAAMPVWHHDDGSYAPY